MDTFKEVERVRREVTDPIDRWRQLTEILDRTTGITVHVAAARGEVVQEMRRSGLSLQQTADLLGISKTRAAQIESQREV